MFLLAFLIASFIVSLVEVLRSSFIPVGPDVQTVSAVSSADNPRSPGSFADLAEKLKPSVVNISTTKTIRSGRGGKSGSPFDRYFWGDDFFERFFGDIPKRVPSFSAGNRPVCDRPERETRPGTGARDSACGARQRARGTGPGRDSHRDSAGL